jgi:hypothetical protein
VKTNLRDCYGVDVGRSFVALSLVTRQSERSDLGRNPAADLPCAMFELASPASTLPRLAVTPKL